MEGLPHEVTLRILLHLDARTLLMLRASCRTLRAACDDPWLFRSFFPRVPRTDQRGVELLVHAAMLESLCERGEVAMGPLADVFCAVDVRSLDPVARLCQDTSLSCGGQWLAHELRRCATKRFVLEQWREVVASGRVAGGARDVLEYGVGLVALSFAPQLRLEEVWRRLDALASEMRPAGGRVRDAVQAALDVMRAHHIGPATGARYYETTNSLVHLVVADGGVGIPISLSMVLRSLLVRHGRRVELLNMPGHYVMSFLEPDGSLFVVDAYRFSIVSVDDFRATYEQDHGTWSDTFMEPELAPSSVWVRMLSNICFASQRAEHVDEMITAMQQLLVHYVAQRSTQAAPLHFALLRHCAERMAKPELLWCTEQETPPMLPRLGAGVTDAIVAGWLDGAPVPRPAGLASSVHLGGFVVGPPDAHALRGVVVGWREAQPRLLVLYEGEHQEERWEDEHALSFLDGSQGVALHNVRAGMFFVHFKHGRYVLNSWMRKRYAHEQTPMH